MQCQISMSICYSICLLVIICFIYSWPTFGDFILILNNKGRRAVSLWKMVHYCLTCRQQSCAVMQILRQFCDYVYVWWVLSASNLGTVSLPVSSRCVRVNKVLRKLTSGLRILTKGRIAPALVTPARRMSPFWSVAFILPWRAAPADKSTAPAAAGVCWVYSLMHFNDPLGDPGPCQKHGVLVPPKSTTQAASRSVQPFV